MIKHVIRVPTLFALGLILTALFLGLAIFFYRQELALAQARELAPRDIQIANISDTSATIAWHTDKPTRGEVLSGSRNNLSQITQDESSQSGAIVHMVTLKDLRPQTTYYFQIKSNGFVSPPQPLEFKTASVSETENRDYSLQKPVVGKVVESNLEPTAQALVYLKILGASPLVTSTSAAGNFIIPLAALRTENLNTLYKISDKTEALLSIKRGELQSEVRILLPLENSLPPLVLGQNIDLTKRLDPLEPINKYDINSDGKVNAVDLSIVIVSLGKSSLSGADVNGDGRVDTVDLDGVKNALR